MDKNTIIGFLLILLVILGFSYLNRPNPEQVEAQRRYNDSIAAVQQESINRQIAEAQALSEADKTEKETAPDSVVLQKQQERYGNFASSIQGEEELITLENELVKIGLTSKGGRIYSAQLKRFSNYEEKPLVLFDDDESTFNIHLFTANNRDLNTSDFYFEVIRNSDLQVTFRLKAGDTGSLDFVYALHPDDYMVDFVIFNKNLENELSPAMQMDFQWSQKIRQQERGRKFEDRYANLSYKYLSDDVENLRENKSDVKNIGNKVKWIAYKDQFFSSVLIAKESFESPKLESVYFNEGPYMKEYKTVGAKATLISNSPEGLTFNYYFGPNDYALLKSYDKTKFEGQNLELEKLVPLGWSLFRYINKWVIIPIFDWLTGWCGSLGLAIFLLTLIIKSALFPLTYKSFMSSAKMRVLKPQTEAITKKYPGQENAMTRQQKNMELYRQVGVNPMAGCLPMLLQMPFLFALFWFFPAAIELRHESFLWASDLSTYDAIIQWNANIPLVTQYFGNHISVFCLLMTIVNIINTKYSMGQNAGQEQMPGMKVMMYLMPVFMLVFLNSYPAGLNYYYFISTLITIIQTIAFRFFLNEEKLLAKLEANKGKPKPAKKKSGFMARLEEAQRKQQAMMKEQQKKNRKK
jgi:YidC/Oxa1 family membrane protein insertase